jgi:hypothetical protein
MRTNIRNSSNILQAVLKIKYTNFLTFLMQTPEDFAKSFFQMISFGMITKVLKNTSKIENFIC